MKDYCSCGFQHSNQPAFGVECMVCPDCEKPFCCDAVVLGLTQEPEHAAEIGDGAHFICWRHWNFVAPLSRYAA